MSLKKISLFGTLLGLPFSVHAEEIATNVAKMGTGTFLGIFVLTLVVSAVLIELWGGIFNHRLLHTEDLSSIQKRKPYLPSLYSVLFALVATGGVILLAITSAGGIPPFTGEHATRIALMTFMAVSGVMLVVRALVPKSRDYIFACAVGTVITFVILAFSSVFFAGNAEHNPFLMSLTIVATVIAWRFLFGPWESHIKASVLGTFVFWILMFILSKETSTQRVAHLLSIVIALIPAFIWMSMFLDYHRQRKSTVALMFFAGMLATAPILFYDALVRHGVEFQFFLFRIVPENFNRSTNTFLAGSSLSATALKTALMTALVSFLIVGLIEEVSKAWVLMKSGKKFFQSIDDVLQLSIIVAIGFSFAENVLNPLYFQSFVQAYLLSPETPMWMEFLGNVLGRSILTTMVHVLASGILGYFLGIAFFARDPNGVARKGHVISSFLQRYLALPEKLTFKRESIVVGLFLAVVLHGLFNFLVTLPDILPGNPSTIGEIFGMEPGTILSEISFLLLPSLFYVVGGMWLLALLFGMKENRREQGHKVQTDVFVLEKAHA